MKEDLKVHENVGNTTNLLYCVNRYKRGTNIWKEHLLKYLCLQRHGKRGGGRVIYVDIELKETIYFINVYTKNEKDDLTEDEKKAFKAVVKFLKEEWLWANFLMKPCKVY